VIAAMQAAGALTQRQIGTPLPSPVLFTGGPATWVEAKRPRGAQPKECLGFQADYQT
jgi:hypothetical protein